MSKTKQALVLDFGGVISRTLFETHAQTEEALGLPPGSLTWRGPFDLESDPLWQSMLADEISERDYWHTRAKEVGKLIGEDWNEMSVFVKAARGADVANCIRPEALDAITRVKEAGMKLAILSNELDLFYGPELRKSLAFLDKFDVIVDATYTKILKPDPRAYQQCIDELQLAAIGCVFVDDQIRNIKGAQEVEMRTVHFDVLNPATSYAQALELLGLGFNA